ncbi:MAG: hypothetical protein WBS24_18375 [Terriglobales bacterium]
MTLVTARSFLRDQNLSQEGFMPILMVALIALGVFGLIGVFLGAAVVLEQRKVPGKHHPGKVA